MRSKMAVANWKMNKDREEARQFARGLRSQGAGITGAEIVVCPPFTALDIMAQELSQSSVRWGGQNCFWEEKGAYTGEISAAMLKDSGCRYVILGHSERRLIMGENDAAVNRKMSAVLQAGLIPILCVGETLQERQDDLAQQVVKEQLHKDLLDLDIAPAAMVIAYEPVWAIGTGVNASSDDAQQMIGFIRAELSQLLSPETADTISILYGGSVRDDNIAEIMQEKDIDGALIGGASLKLESFLSIARSIADG